MSMTPILKRELLVAARRGRIVGRRATFAGIFLGLVLAIFAAWYFGSGFMMSRGLMSFIAWQSFMWLALAHVALVPFRAAAESIAGERERQTLDFLMSTRLTSAEIVLGKLTACMSQYAMYAAAGLPVVLLLHVCGGVDIGLIAITYGALFCLAFFLIALSIWISVGAADTRRALSYSVLAFACWIVVPINVSAILPRTGLWVPALVYDVNAWVLASSPIGVLYRFAGGVANRSALLHSGAEMCGLQLAAGAVLIVWSIIRLRFLFRSSTSTERKGFVQSLIRPGWRFFERPRCGDDAIFWRETTAVRANFVSRAIGLVMLAGVYCGLIYIVLFFMNRAVIELWHHGYSAVRTTATPPEWNWIDRFSHPDYGLQPPVEHCASNSTWYCGPSVFPSCFCSRSRAQGCLPRQS